MNEKYRRWWFDWSLELLRFSNRVGTYLALMADRYPSTDERQWVQLDYPRGIFHFVEGVIRWHNRVVGYAFILITDRYPPFSLSQSDAPLSVPAHPAPRQG